MAGGRWQGRRWHALRASCFDSCVLLVLVILTHTHSVATPNAAVFACPPVSNPSPTCRPQGWKEGEGLGGTQKGITAPIKASAGAPAAGEQRGLGATAVGEVRVFWGVRVYRRVWHTLACAFVCVCVCVCVRVSVCACVRV